MQTTHDYLSGEKIKLSDIRVNVVRLSGISCDLKMKLNNIHGNFVGHFNDCCTSILRLSLGICETFCKIRLKFTKFMYCINFLSVRLQRENCIIKSLSKRSQTGLHLLHSREIWALPMH